MKKKVENAYDAIYNWKPFLFGPEHAYSKISVNKAEASLVSLSQVVVCLSRQSVTLARALNCKETDVKYACSAYPSPEIFWSTLTGKRNKYIVLG
jgi:hypothetical protein